MLGSILWSGCALAPACYHVYRGVDNLSGASRVRDRIEEYCRKRPFAKHGFLASGYFKQLFDKELGLQRDILFFPAIDIPYAAALGSNFSSAAIVLYNPKLKELNEKAFRVIGLHEMAHLMNNDGFMNRSIAALSAAVSAYVTPYFLALFPSSIVPFLYPGEIAIPFAVGMMVWNMRTRIREDAADDFAFQHAKDEELQEYENFIAATIEAQKELHHQYPDVFSSDGNQLQQSTHALDGERLIKTGEELERRGVPSKSLDVMKMNEMREFVKREFLAEVESKSK